MNLRDNLTNKYVAFLDVLGFKELVFSRRIDELETYFEVIRETLLLLRNDKKNIESLLVSDSTILLSPDSTEDFITLLKAVQTIQAKLAEKSIWLRGGISFGEVYFDHSSNVIVGKGLINAYLLESEAKFPKVIIDTSIIPRIAENRQRFYETVNPQKFDFDRIKLVHNWYRFIPDDSFFVSYGHKIILKAIENRSMQLVYDNILKNLYADQRNYEKHLWVRNYFMDVILEIDQLWGFSNLSDDRESRIYLNTW